MMTVDKAYEKFYNLLEKIEADLSPTEQYELYQDIESEIEYKKTKIVCRYARMVRGESYSSREHNRYIVLDDIR